MNETGKLHKRNQTSAAIAITLPCSQLQVSDVCVTGARPGGRFDMKPE